MRMPMLALLAAVLVLAPTLAQGGGFLSVLTTGDPDVTVRLEEGDRYGAGRLGVFHDGYWGSVCDGGWDDTDARVVCRQLGLSGGKAIKRFGGGVGYIWFDMINCRGDENRLEDCNHHEYGREDTLCYHTMDAGISCDVIPSTEDIDKMVRLVEGDQPGKGRVEIKIHGIWGTVCDHLWDDVDARIVCRQLGYNRGTAIKTYGGGSGVIWLTGVRCKGISDTRLEDCRHQHDWGVHDCDHSRDAGVICE